VNVCRPTCFGSLSTVVSETLHLRAIIVALPNATSSGSFKICLATHSKRSGKTISRFAIRHFNSRSDLGGESIFGCIERFLLKVFAQKPWHLRDRYHQHEAKMTSDNPTAFRSATNERRQIACGLKSLSATGMTPLSKTIDFSSPSRLLSSTSSCSTESQPS